MSEWQTNPEYLVSMSGLHGAGKGTLCEGLCQELGLRTIAVKIFALGRMLDEEGLRTCRENALEQNRLLREGGTPQRVATSRLGLLDVAIYAMAMARFGRIDAGYVEGLCATLAADLAAGYQFPEVLIAMVCRAEVLQERLLARDAEKGLKATRGTKALERMFDIVCGIYRDSDYPHACIAEVVEFYRRRGRLLFIDSSELGIGEVRARAVAFLEGHGLLATR